jgi:hypothetical protein
MIYIFCKRNKGSIHDYINIKQINHSKNFKILNYYLFCLVQKNSAVAGAITGATLALTQDDSSHEQIVQCAITGAAISTAANLLTGIF